MKRAAAALAAAHLLSAALADECTGAGAAACRLGAGPQQCLDLAGSWFCVCDGGRGAAVRGAGANCTGPALVALSDRSAAGLSSDAVNTGGHALEIQALVPFTAPAWEVVVVGPGEAPPPAAVVLRSSAAADDEPGGLVATARRDPGVATVRVLAGTGWLTLAHRDYVLLPPAVEVLRIFVPSGLLGGPGGPCVPFCLLSTTLRPSAPHLPAHAGTVAQIGVASAVMGAVSFFVPGGPLVGPNAAVLAMTARAALCPLGREAGVRDLTLNPLGLRVGDGSSAAEEAAGAVAGALILLLSVLVLYLLAMLVVYLRIRPLIALDREIDGPVRDDEARRLDKNFILVHARVGHLYVLFGFLYPSALVGVFGTFASGAAWYMYVAAAFVLVAVAAGWGTVLVISLAAPRWCRYGPPEERRGWWRALLRGRNAWAPRAEVRGSLAWRELNNQAFATLRPKHRHWFPGVLVYIALLAALMAWDPSSRVRCWERMLGMLVLSILSLCLLAASRPYIAAACHAVALVVLTSTSLAQIGILLALGHPNPTQHWGTAAARALLLVGNYVNVLRFLLDCGCFLAREYEEWATASAGKGSVLLFARHVLVGKGATSTWAYYQQRDFLVRKETPMSADDYVDATIHDTLCPSEYTHTTPRALIPPDNGGVASNTEFDYLTIEGTVVVPPGAPVEPAVTAIGTRHPSPSKHASSSALPVAVASRRLRRLSTMASPTVKTFFTDDQVERSPSNVELSEVARSPLLPKMRGFRPDSSTYSADRVQLFPEPTSPKNVAEPDILSPGGPEADSLCPPHPFSPTQKGDARRTTPRSATVLRRGPGTPRPFGVRRYQSDFDSRISATSPTPLSALGSSTRRRRAAGTALISDRESIRESIRSSRSPVNIAGASAAQV